MGSEIPIYKVKKMYGYFTQELLHPFLFPCLVFHHKEGNQAPHGYLKTPKDLVPICFLCKLQLSVKKTGILSQNW